MIVIENIEVSGWEAAIRGMRNPLNSWEKSDSVFYDCDHWHDICGNEGENSVVETGFDLGYADGELMKKLAAAGEEHAKFRRMIVATMDILAPLYWWKEFDTYKVGTVANSCSTMHTIHKKEFTEADFSIEHLADTEAVISDMPQLSLSFEDVFGMGYIGGFYLNPYGVFNVTLAMLNRARKLYLETKDKRYWWQMIQLLPSSYNQRRTVMLNYQVLAEIYRQRQGHKLDEWRFFCEMIEKVLPHSEIITGGKIFSETGDSGGVSE